MILCPASTPPRTKPTLRTEAAHFHPTHIPADGRANEAGLWAENFVGNFFEDILWPRIRADGGENRGWVAPERGIGFSERDIRG